jgi:hypothetical protein
MPFQVSPGVNVSEVDLSTVVPAVSTTEGAIAGVFKWGPAKTRVLIDSEETLVARFGKPYGDLNPETFFTAANFLAYGNKLYVSRVVDSASRNAATASGVLIENEDKLADVTVGSTNHFVARYPGKLGDSLQISVCKSAGDYSEAGVINVTVVSGANSGTLSANASALNIKVGDIAEFGNTTTGVQRLEVTAITDGASPTINFKEKYTGVSNVASLAIKKLWKYHDLVSAAPGTSTYAEGKDVTGDELHIVVVDEDGDISGTKGTVLEVYEGVSRATDAKTESGESNYFIDVIERSSQWIYAKEADNLVATNTAINISALTTNNATYDSLTGGVDSLAEGSVTLADVASGYDLFKSAEDIDVSLILQGKAIGGTHGEGLGKHLIDNICESRKDCVAFISPEKGDVVNNIGSELDDIKEFRNTFNNSSYAFMDSGYKYQYDKFNDVYRYVPLNGDIAGLAVRSDELRDAWFSPAGYNRGAIKNLVKLAFNPKKAERDGLYQSDINPVVTFPGQGTILFGDKTLLGKPSAFDRINVRRLFIVLEKAIATASKFSLFEFNDAFTRSQFKNLVEPFLRDIQGRRGIVDFRVVCDETNNTGEVIDRNEFVGDIYVKPSRSINFIQLNFVAVRSGVEFSEVVGQF